MSLDDSILKEFIEESKSLISQGLEILEEVESDPGKIKSLETYGNYVDRIMGGAKSLAMMVNKTHPLNFVSDYCALCKAVGYKSSQIVNNEPFLMICVGILLDATETLKELIDKLAEGQLIQRNAITQTFLDRLQWVSNQFGKGMRETVGKKGMEQNDIDQLLKKLGVG